MQRMQRVVALASLSLVCSTWLASSASAALIRPAAGRAYPDIAADINGVVTYTYDSAAQGGTFQVTNTPYLIAGGPTSSKEFAVTPTDLGVRQQMLSVSLDKNGNFVSSPTNSYSLYGTVVAEGRIYTGLLLSGTPTAFGSQDLDSVGITGSDVFDVDVAINGGSMAQFFGTEAYLRITPELQSTFRGRFDESFSATKATSNTRSYVSPQPFPIPEPGTWLVLALGGLGWAGARRIRGGR